MKLITFADQPDFAVRVRLDDGRIIESTNEFVVERPCAVNELPADTPNGNGAARLIIKPGYDTIEQHGVLWLDRINPATGSVAFDVDTVILHKTGSGSHPFV